jgi:hypothetical protein
MSSSLVPSSSQKRTTSPSPGGRGECPGPMLSPPLFPLDVGAESGALPHQGRGAAAVLAGGREGQCRILSGEIRTAPPSGARTDISTTSSRSSSPASPTTVPHRRTRHLLKRCLRPAQTGAVLQGALLPSAWRAGLHGSCLPPLHLIPNPSSS